MKVKAFYSRKIQLDDFEPIQHSAEVQREVGDDEDWEEVYGNLAERVEDVVESELARRVRDKKLGEEDDE